MKRDLQKMVNTDLGILIIGGGITGAGIARDAANRGIKVALVEKNDFACGTTSRSIMLAHGVFSVFEGKSGSSLKESLHERAVLQYIAKDITHPVTFLTPSYQDDKRKLSHNKFGFTMYNMFAGAKKVQSPQSISADETLKLERNLGKDGLLGGAVYEDSYTCPERLVVSNLWDAFEHGAQISNHCEAVSLLLENGKVIGATVKDLLDGKTYDIKAKVVVNATGAWIDKLLESANKKIGEWVKEISLVVPKFTEKEILLSGKSNNQVFFVIPQNEYSLIGTTVGKFEGNLDEVHVTEDESKSLLDEINHFFPSSNLKKTDVLFGYASVQPLKWETKVPHESSGLISVISGKLGEYRLTAQRVVDLIHYEYGVPQERKCQTDKQPLLYQKFPSEQEAYLRLQDVFEKSPALNTLFKNEKVVKANEYKFRVALACELEMARTLADFLFGRSQIGYRQGLGLDILPIIADHMASFLGWKSEEKQAQIENYKSYVNANLAIR
jgi:glycerol-3-phosphate dehydrogenase